METWISHTVFWKHIKISHLSPRCSGANRLWVFL